MGKLLKAGADARHFLSQFRSLTKMAELVDGLSGLDNEVLSLEKRKEVVEKELLVLESKLTAEQGILRNVMEATEAEEEKAVNVKSAAVRAATDITNAADQSVAKQHAKDMSSLKTIQLQAREEQISFDNWHKEAEKTKEEILRDTSKLKKALADLRAKLL